MKILVAIESSKNSDELTHTTLRWASRGGFNTRVFIPDKRQLDKYKRAIEEVNYHYYVDLPYEIIVPNQKPMDFAREEGYDLLVYLPDSLLDWRTVGDDDKTVIDYAEDLATARSKFGNIPELNIFQFMNGVKMVRVK